MEQVIDDNCPYSTTKKTCSQVKLAEAPFVRYFLFNLSIVPMVVTMIGVSTMWSLKNGMCVLKGMTELVCASTNQIRSVEIVETKFFQRYFWFLSITLLPLALKDPRPNFPSSRQPSIIDR